MDKVMIANRRIDKTSRFGRLTCIEMLSIGEFGGAIWKCRCDCGAVAEVSEAMLISGVRRSCGCTSGHAINLEGQRFGGLTVLEPVPERGTDGSVRWLCRCDCGKECDVLAASLRSGKRTSCGCDSKKGKHRVKNVTGQKFAMLTALYPIGSAGIMVRSSGTVGAIAATKWTLRWTD